MKAPVTLFWNKAKTTLVPIGHAEARHHAYHEGQEMQPGDELKVMHPAANKKMPAPDRKSAAGEAKE